MLTYFIATMNEILDAYRANESLKEVQHKQESIPLPLSNLIPPSKVHLLVNLIVGDRNWLRKLQIV